MSQEVVWIRLALERKDVEELIQYYKAKDDGIMTPDTITIVVQLESELAKFES